MTQDLWNQRIGILCAAGVGMPLRSRLATLDLDPAAMRTLVQAAVKAGRSEHEIAERLRSAAAEHASTSLDLELPVGESAVATDAKEPAGELQAETRAGEPCTGGKRKSGRIEAGTGRRKLRTVETNDTMLMTETTKKTSEPATSSRLRVASEGKAPDPKRDGQGRGRPVKAENRPPSAATTDLALLTVGDVARLLKLSQRQIWKLAKARRLPAPLRLGRSVRWRVTDLARFLEVGADPAKYNEGLA